MVLTRSAIAAAAVRFFVQLQVRNLHPASTATPALTPSGSHKSVCGRQAGGTHPTGMLSCYNIISYFFLSFSEATSQQLGVEIFMEFESELTQVISQQVCTTLPVAHDSFFIKEF